VINPSLEESDAAFVRNPQLNEPPPSSTSSLDKTRQLGQQALSSIDHARLPAARVLQNVAASMHDAAPRMPGGDKVVKVVHRAAHSVNSTARYVRHHSINDIGSDLLQKLRRNPEGAMLTALAVGFVLGMAISNDND
jgi:hypothetical protein